MSHLSGVRGKSGILTVLVFITLACAVPPVYAFKHIALKNANHFPVQCPFLFDLEGDADFRPSNLRFVELDPKTDLRLNRDEKNKIEAVPFGRFLGKDCPATPAEKPLRLIFFPLFNEDGDIELLQRFFTDSTVVSLLKNLVNNGIDIDFYLTFDQKIVPVFNGGRVDPLLYANERGINLKNEEVSFRFKEFMNNLADYEYDGSGAFRQKTAVVALWDQKSKILSATPELNKKIISVLNLNESIRLILALKAVEKMKKICGANGMDYLELNKIVRTDGDLFQKYLTEVLKNNLVNFYYTALPSQYTGDSTDRKFQLYTPKGKKILHAEVPQSLALKVWETHQGTVASQVKKHLEAGNVQQAQKESGGLDKTHRKIAQEDIDTYILTEIEQALAKGDIDTARTRLSELTDSKKGLAKEKVTGFIADKIAGLTSKGRPFEALALLKKHGDLLDGQQKKQARHRIKKKLRAQVRYRLKKKNLKSASQKISGIKAQMPGEKKFIAELEKELSFRVSDHDVNKARQAISDNRLKEAGSLLVRIKKASGTPQHIIDELEADLLYKKAEADCREKSVKDGIAAYEKWFGLEKPLQLADTKPRQLKLAEVILKKCVRNCADADAMKIIPRFAGIIYSSNQKERIRNTSPYIGEWLVSGQNETALMTRASLLPDLDLAVSGLQALGSGAAISAAGKLDFILGNPRGQLEMTRKAYMAASGDALFPLFKQYIALSRLNAILPLTEVLQDCFFNGYITGADAMTLMGQLMEKPVHIAFRHLVEIRPADSVSGLDDTFVQKALQKNHRRYIVKTSVKKGGVETFEYHFYLGSKTNRFIRFAVSTHIDPAQMKIYNEKALSAKTRDQKLKILHGYTLADCQAANIFSCALVSGVLSHNAGIPAKNIVVSFFDDLTKQNGILSYALLLETSASGYQALIQRPDTLDQDIIENAQLNNSILTFVVSGVSRPGLKEVGAPFFKPHQTKNGDLAMQKVGMIRIGMAN